MYSIVQVQTRLRIHIYVEVVEKTQREMDPTEEAAEIIQVRADGV